VATKQTRPTALRGAATADGTVRYAERFAARTSPDLYRPLGSDGLRVSSVGLGTYLGECDDDDDARYLAAVQAALASGINLLDTAINYRCQRSERVVGKAVGEAVRAKHIKRDQIVICSKGGYIPLDGTAPATREQYQTYLNKEYFQRGIMSSTDVVAGAHCMAPGYLADQIARSRRNLNVETIDLYYLHNPEQQLDVLPRDLFRVRLRQAFMLLEEKCAKGEIRRYGVATWNGFRVPPDSKEHLDLQEVVQTAREAAEGQHHFAAVQLPVNLALTEAVRAPTQRLASGQTVSFLQAAAELGIAVIASASLMQARLASGLPAEVHEALPGYKTDAQRAIAFVRSLPVIASALVGMKSVAHVEENVAVGRAVHLESP
jgi:aryl-alcohol dehydrogenase-like predicted oxidoreductase